MFSVVVVLNWVLCLLISEVIELLVHRVFVFCAVCCSFFYFAPPSLLVAVVVSKPELLTSRYVMLVAAGATFISGF